MVHTRVSRAATGCTMSSDGSDERAPLGSEKSESLFVSKSPLESGDAVSKKC